ncbi:uncharacterized protein LOC107424299 [Ziziphus jujuba]|uniref:Uncharacterized protein LOC107424299 n=1 Tax=Ziziphus jujuba TaxID=326968 RepID=A0ABM3ITH7_ZIZJJ|nr:uncharacterized protein LOC107424299 [Ziziphus jujuba]XP_048335165.1 uncharacterized protein LOC107424299 [Ziziphus jujuba]XP_048335166.1 uncharacterized protein LOC107424299 [Ziziphus jujuba]XP_060675008.1 uncharacterized protein LOC107424299 [Ziziphus jujuba]
MGGLLHLFDFNQGSMARKVRTHKKGVGGHEAPGNSLELQVENSQRYCAAGDLPVEEDRSGKNNYPFETSMKKLINEEISKCSSTRQNAPSIVARLMGIDMASLDTKSIVQPIEKKNEPTKIKGSNKETNGRGLINHVSSNSNSSRQPELDLFYHDGDREAGRLSNGQKLGKPRRREHPQEEELQKFKKEFEAWQAARFKECSRVAELEIIHSHWLPQEDLNEEMIGLHSKSGRTAFEKPVEPKSSTIKARSHERIDLGHHGDQMELFPFEQKGSYPRRSRTLSRDFDQYSLMSSSQKIDPSFVPTRIVVLKPGPDRLCNPEESWSSSSGTSEQRGSIEDFLEEVKERLKCEMQGKTIKRGSVVRGSGIETPYSEKPANPKQIAQHIAKQVRESVSRDMGVNLLRSESTRSYRSEIQLNGPGSPEFINRDTRRFLSDRLRNVLKRETELNVPCTAVGDSSTSSVLHNERARARGDVLKKRNETDYSEIVKDEQEMQTRSFRHGLGDDVMLHRELSPRNLVRSLSAPVSGTSFGKLLLEDRHILTGAQIRRKHEAIEKVSFDMKKRKKEKFNFKERVSNFRYSFTLRGRLFGKKMQSILESNGEEHDPMKDIMSGPTVTNFGERHVRENFTEVPPSPASVCSSAQEDFWRPVDYLSPLSTPDLTPRDDYIVPQVFREISSNLNELRRQLNQLESDEPEDTVNKQEPIEPEMVEIKDPAEAYIRDLLVAAGLYDGSSEKHLSRWETLAKPVSISVFEEVEESYKKMAKEQENSLNDHDEKKVDHKVLLDLLNETLSTVLTPPLSLSKFWRNIINTSTLPPLHGKKLLDRVWRVMCEHLYPPDDRCHYSLDSMVGRDMRLTPWSGLISEEVYSIGREMESLIMGDLVEEILQDMQSFIS